MEGIYAVGAGLVVLVHFAFVLFVAAGALLGLKWPRALWVHLPAVAFRPAKDVPHLHPARSAELTVNGRAVGTFGELHPTVAATAGLAERAVQVAELDLEAVLAAVPDRFPYRPFPTVPPAKRDIAVIVPEAMSRSVAPSPASNTSSPSAIRRPARLAGTSSASSSSRPKVTWPPGGTISTLLWLNAAGSWPRTCITPAPWST